MLIVVHPLGLLGPVQAGARLRCALRFRCTSGARLRRAPRCSVQGLSLDRTLAPRCSHAPCDTWISRDGSGGSSGTPFPHTPYSQPPLHWEGTHHSFELEMHRLVDDSTRTRTRPLWHLLLTRRNRSTNGNRRSHSSCMQWSTYIHHMHQCGDQHSTTQGQTIHWEAWGGA